MNSELKEKVAVLGASPKRERTANQAVHLLQEFGHQVYPVNPAYKKIDELDCYSSLKEIPVKIDTITVYVGPDKISPLISEIIEAQPKRVILNPGAESSPLKEALRKSSIPYEEACTLVLLRTEQF